MKHILPLIAVSLIACQDGPTAKPWALPAEEGAATQSAEPAAARPTPVAQSGDEAYVVHEWGTYTSLQGSDGAQLPGMHYEEESLPAFVYGRIPPMPGQPPSKDVESLLLDGITQKLETPVIYFYGAPSRVDVTVDFPRGVISQWYPNATAFAPEVFGAAFDANDILNGQMTWSLDVLDYDETAGMIDVPEDDVWAPSRNVDAQPVRFGDEVEKFIFYRGLGRFDAPFRVTSTGSQLELHNDSGQQIPDAWILHWNGERGAVWPLGPIEANTSTRYSPTPKELPRQDYLDVARNAVADGLIRSGLTEDESWAMVDTWNHSYFKSTGLRVLYVAPRVWTDEFLPITITPEPDELVRTLIGRVEVMTEAEEQALLDDLRAGMTAEDVGRFAEPRLQRVLQLTDDADLRRQILGLIAQVRGLPSGR